MSSMRRRLEKKVAQRKAEQRFTQAVRAYRRALALELLDMQGAEAPKEPEVQIQTIPASKLNSDNLTAEANINVKTAAEPAKPAERIAPTKWSEAIKLIYEQEKMNSTTLAALFECSSACVQHWAHDERLPSKERFSKSFEVFPWLDISNLKFGEHTSYRGKYAPKPRKHGSKHGKRITPPETATALVGRKLQLSWPQVMEMLYAKYSRKQLASYFGLASPSSLANWSAFRPSVSQKDNFVKLLPEVDFDQLDFGARHPTRELRKRAQRELGKKVFGDLRRRLLEGHESQAATVTATAPAPAAPEATTVETASGRGVKITFVRPKVTLPPAGQFFLWKNELFQMLADGTCAQTSIGRTLSGPALESMLAESEATLVDVDITVRVAV